MPTAPAARWRWLADMIDREVNQNRWVANDPFFLPGYLLDNMPAYQTGMLSAVGRFTTELRDRVARVRGSSAVDPDLESAARAASTTPATSGSSSGRARRCSRVRKASIAAGMDDLRRYNERLAQGQAVYERRADNLLATLDRISNDLGGDFGGTDPGGGRGHQQLPRLQRRQSVLQHQGQALRLLPDPARAGEGLRACHQRRRTFRRAGPSC